MKPNPFLAYLCYDPRDPDQCLRDRATWKHSTNGILIVATMLHTKQFPVSWDKVAAFASMTADDERIHAMPATQKATVHAAAPSSTRH